MTHKTIYYLRVIDKFYMYRFIEPNILFSNKCSQTILIEEFDHGSDWTLAAGLTHASRAVTESSLLLCWRAADGWVMLGNMPLGGGQQLETTANTA